MRYCPLKDSYCRSELCPLFIEELENGNIKCKITEAIDLYIEDTKMKLNKSKIQVPLLNDEIF